MSGSTRAADEKLVPERGRQCVEDGANLTKVLVSFKIEIMPGGSHSSGGPEECRSGAPSHGASLKVDLVGVLVRYNLRAIKWLKLQERGEPQRDAQLAV